jgi:nicotinamidase-related amidase
MHRVRFGPEEVLRACGVSTRGGCGIVTNCCVETTARDAAGRAYAGCDRR